ncbi:GntR family transcriptional regulator [Streptomyces sp. NBC_01497]|uniref:GntR family transcriptional regulator n=1 Tax=Streptomyces sp. NBC_01497 TaxID=2903885 RepID=UPI002E35A2FB|nr:GntR family transcriptional regulator [Streptomyces sp. NBC_01497]
MNTTPEGTAPLTVDHHEPLWVQAAAVIEQRVADGTLPPGRRLPAERELCAQLDISRVTLRRALTHLGEQGVLRNSHGRGWYAAGESARQDRAAGAERADREWPNSLESFTETARRKGLVPSSRVLRSATGPASLDEADEFGVAAGTELFRLDRVRLLDGLPIGIDASRVVLGLAPHLTETDFSRSSMLAELTAAGCEPVNAESMIEARGCPEDLAEHLGLGPGDPVLVMQQTMADAGGRTVLVTTITYRGDRYRLRTAFVRGGSL